MNDSQIYSIMFPDMLLIGQHRGEIIGINSIGDFNSQIAEKFPQLERFAHGQIAADCGGWAGIHPAWRADSLIFTHRSGGPDLQPTRDCLDNAVIDLSVRGLLTAMAVLAIQRGKRTGQADWLFEDGTLSSRRASEFLEAHAALWRIHADAMAEHCRQQAASMGSGGDGQVINATTH